MATKKDDTAGDQEYTADQLSVLKGLEAVRVRPGMYIGSTDSRGLMHLIWEIVDNSVDEAAAGHCSRIELILHTDGSFEVHDNGRGIPVDVEKSTGKSGLELIFTELHAGGKFGGGGYAASGGLHGVGASVVNALSTKLVSEVDRNNKTYRVEFRDGETGVWDGDTFTAKEGIREVGKSKGTGTRVQWWPNTEIFDKAAKVDKDLIVSRMRQLCFLVPGLTVVLRDEVHGDVQEFTSEDGISDFCEYLTHGEKVTDVIKLVGSGSYSENIPQMVNGQLVTTEVERTMDVEVALRWTAGWEPLTKSFVNTITTPKGGTHTAGFERALTRVVNEALRENKVLKDKDDNVIKDDVQEGLVAVVRVVIVEPQFEGQTKEILGTPAAQSIVYQVVSEGLRDWFSRNAKKPGGRNLLQKVSNAAKARIAARTQRETVRRKNAIESSSLPAKLADCRTHDLERSELLTIEGDSAGGCLTWNTCIPCLDSVERTIQELAEDWERGVAHFGYATNEDGDVVAVPLVEPRLTTRGAELVEVEVEGGFTLTCTPDHPVRLRDGSYKAAGELQPGDSLMPLYVKYSQRRAEGLNGYEMVWRNGRQEWAYTHHLADLWNLAHGLDDRDNGNVRHHVDCNKLNNDPRNLQRMDRVEHIELHGSMAKAMWEDETYRAKHLPRLMELNQGEENIQARAEGFQRWWAGLDDTARELELERLSSMVQEYWSDPENRAAQSDRVRAFFEANPERKASLSELAKEQWSDPELRAWRSEATREQMQDPEQRAVRSRAVKAWWAENPEVKALKTAIVTSEATRAAQRAGQRAYLERTTVEERGSMVRNAHQLSALKMLQNILAVGEHDVASRYDCFRLANSRTSPKYSTILSRYGSEAELWEAARLVNHEVVAVRPAGRGDVYDITVDGYHNFAVGDRENAFFVHNSAKAARDSEFQALLPLRGKILNVAKASPKQVLENAEVIALISALGAGFGKEFDTSQLRYGRFIIMCDADVDGSHIRVLILTLIYHYMRPLLEEGRVYSAMPPLYMIKVSGSKEHHYAYTDDEKEQVLARIEAEGKKVREVQRFKGLGEMDAEQLAITTMDPNTRSLRRISMDDAAEAARVFDVLMGNAVEPRRDFITSRAEEFDYDKLDV